MNQSIRTATSSKTYSKESSKKWTGNWEDKKYNAFWT